MALSMKENDSIFVKSPLQSVVDVLMSFMATIMVMLPIFCSSMDVTWYCALHPQNVNGGRLAGVNYGDLDGGRCKQWEGVNE